MATVTITSSKNVTSAIKYAGTGEVVNNYEHLDGQRVLASGGNNVDPNDATFQMQFVQQSYGKEMGYLQAYRVIQSFSTDALDPKDESNWDLSNQLGIETAEELYPNHQTVVFTHADGDGGQLHNHIIVNAVALDGASLSTNRSFRAVGKGSNNVLDRHGIDNLGNDYLYEFYDHNKDDKETDVERRIKARDDYSWKEDLNNKVEAARQSESVFNTEDFKEHLQARYQIDVVKGKRDYHYEFKDETEEKRTITARKLNKDFREKDLNKTFKGRADALAEQEQINQEESESLEDRFADFTDDFDAEAELRRRRPRKPVESERVEQSEESKKIGERIKQRTEDEAQAKRDALAAQERQAEVQRQAKVQFDKEQERKRLQKIEDDKKEVERKRIVAQQQADLEAKQKAEQEAKDIRDDYEKRIQRASISKDPVSDRKIEKFKNAEEEIKRKGVFDGKRYSFNYTDDDINHSANISIADEDRERRQAPAPEQQEDEHELE